MKALKLLLLPPAFIAVGLVRLLDKFGILIRFGEFWSERIGHLAGNTEVYLCERDAGKHPGFHIWFHRHPISNRYLAKMLSRVMCIDRSGFSRIVVLLMQLWKGWERHVVAPIQLDRDILNLFEKQPPHLQFTAAEERRGEAWLKSQGINGKFVCFNVRDSAFFTNRPELSFHDHRDSEIDTYLSAMVELANRGYWVLRMGAKVKKPLPLKHSMIRDYAYDGSRSEFMDIYLGAKCDFAVSTGSGWDAIPYIFRRPVCYVNFVPVEYLFTFTKSVAIWKHHWKDGKRMTLDEMWACGCGNFMQAVQFKEAGITLVDNTWEEIRDTVVEMVKPSTEDQAWFWDKFPRAFTPYNRQPIHGEIRMRIGSKFLESYR